MTEELTKWTSYMGGLKFARIADGLLQGAIHYGVQLTIDNITSQWLRETVYFTATGTPEAIRNFHLQ